MMTMIGCMAMTCDDDDDDWWLQALRRAQYFKQSFRPQALRRARDLKPSESRRLQALGRARDFKHSGKPKTSSPRKGPRLRALGMMTTMMPVPRKNTKTTTQKANGAAAAATVRKPNIQTNIETTRSTFGVQRSNQDATKSKS